MTPVYDDAYNAALADNAAITVVNYSSGAGRLSTIGWYQGDSQTEVGVGINIDGGGEDIAELDDTNILCAHSYGVQYAVVLSGVAYFNLEFQSSLVVKCYNRDGAGAKAVGGSSWYGILSEEVERLVIPAGSPLPHRDYVESEDVLCIMIRGGDGRIGSRLVYPIGEKINIDAGEVQESQFLTELKGPVRQFVKKAVTGSRQIIIDGTYYDISVNDGVIELESIPYLITNVALWDRFTADEQEALIGHTNPKVMVFMHELKVRNKINLRWAKLITAINTMETAGLIGQGRAAEILA